MMMLHSDMRYALWNYIVTHIRSASCCAAFKRKRCLEDTKRERSESKVHQVTQAGKFISTTLVLCCHRLCAVR